MLDTGQIQINLRSEIPIYEQIAEQVRTKIIRGELKPDDQLPTVRFLAYQLRINFNTVARAYRILDMEGWISSQRGRGTYVLAQKPASEMKRNRQEQLAQFYKQIQEDTRRLSLSQAEVLEYLQQQTSGSPARKEESQKKPVRSLKRQVKRLSKKKSTDAPPIHRKRIPKRNRIRFTKRKKE